MQTSCLASKRRLRNQCHKIARVDFVRRVTHKTFVTRGTWGLRVKRRVTAPQTVPKENLWSFFDFFSVSNAKGLTIKAFLEGTLVSLTLRLHFKNIEI